MEAALSEAVIYLAMKFPIFFTIVSFVGMLRFVFKPLTAIIDSLVLASESKVDDTKWEAFKASKVFKGFAWVVDLIASIKLQKKK